MVILSRVAAVKHPPPRCCSSTSAMMERGEFPVQRNSTLYVRWLMRSTPCRTRGGVCSQGNTARGRLALALGRRQRDPACALRSRGAGVLAKHRYGIEGMEGLPGYALRVRHPVLVREGIATGGPGLFEQAGIRRFQLPAHGLEFGIVLHLKTQVIDAGNRNTASRVSCAKAARAVRASLREDLRATAAAIPSSLQGA